MKKFISIFALSFLFGSCTTLKKEDCEKRSAFQLGKMDGLKGMTTQEFDSYTKSCATKFSVQVDQNEYLKGRTEGLAEFCTPKNAYQYGLDGEDYQNVCPKDLEEEFLKPYKLGKREFEIEEKEKELKRREQDLREREVALRNTCSFDSDCEIDGQCNFGQCARGGSSCSFNSDCKIKGRCNSNSEWIDGSYEQVKSCSYQ